MAPTTVSHAPLDHPAVAFATVIEDRPDFRDRALNFALSIRELGGSLAGSDIVVCSVDSVEPRTRAALADLEVHVEVVTVFDQRNRRSNKLRVLEVLAHAGYEHVLSLDSDVIVCGDVSPHLHADAVGLGPAARDALSDADWVALFGAMGVERPARSIVAPLTGELLYPYYNSGVVLVPGDLVGPLHQAWATTERELFDLQDRDPTAISNWVHRNQLSLMITLLRHRFPVHLLPYAMNLHSSGHPTPGSPADARIRPLVLHYHNKIDVRGFLRRTSTPGTARFIERFNAIRAAFTGQTPPPTRWERGLDAKRLIDAARRSLT